MYILTLKGRPDGVFSVRDDLGDQIIPVFEEEDDATRYFYMIEGETECPPLQVIEIPEDAIINACEEKDQKYAIITQDDFIVPPQDL